MKNNPYSITQKNIGLVNDYLQKQYIRNKKLRMAKFIFLPIGLLLFFIPGCLITYGLGCEMVPKMANFPILGQMWNLLCSYIPFSTIEEWYVFIPIFLATMYLPAFVWGGLVYALVFALYRPRQKLDGLKGDIVQKARTLVQNHKSAVHASIFSHVDYSDTIVFSIVYGSACALIMLVAACASCENAEAGLEMFFKQIIPFALVGVVIALISIPFGHFAFQRLNRKKDKYRDEIDRFWVENDEEEATRRKEEEEAKKRRREREEEELIRRWAKYYIQEKKEHEDYQRRLHEWATGDDPPTPGCGDGI